MNINLQGKNIELTDAIKDYVFKKVATLDKYISGDNTDTLMNVEIGKTTNHHNKGDIFRAEMDMIYNGKKFRAVVKTEDLYGSIDEAKSLIERELVENKEKGETLFRRGARSIKKMMKGLSNRNPFTSKY